MKNKIDQVAVWLDHASAEIIEYHNGESVLLETIESPYDRKPRIEGEGSDVTRFGRTYSSNNEDRKHNRLQNELNSYFTDLENRVKDYKEILLFGPTNAKDQLYNRLMENKIFSAKTLAVESVDTLTENQKMAFARDFFKKIT